MTNERLIKIVTNILLYGKTTHWDMTSDKLFKSTGNRDYMWKQWGECTLYLWNSKPSSLIQIWIGIKYNNKTGVVLKSMEQDLNLSNRNDPSVTLLMLLLKDIFPDI